MKRPGWIHTAVFNATTLVAPLRSDEMPVEQAEKFDAHANQIAFWKTQLLK